MSALPQTLNRPAQRRPNTVSRTLRNSERNRPQTIATKRKIGNREREVVLALRKRFHGVSGITVDLIHNALNGRLDRESIDEILNDAADAAERGYAALRADIQGAVSASFELDRQIKAEWQEGW